jgi:hypothetical protein
MGSSRRTRGRLHGPAPVTRASPDRSGIGGCAKLLSVLSHRLFAALRFFASLAEPEMTSKARVPHASAAIQLPS